MNGNLDDLELELRRIPGVVTVGMRRDDRLVLQVVVMPGTDPVEVAERARVLARAYEAAPMIEVVPLEPPTQPRP